MSDIFIALETSGPRTFVSVGDGTRFESVSAHCDDSHNEELASLVQQALTLFSATPNQVTKVLLGVGPGSFTGLRIGMAFAKGFAQSLAIPIATIESTTILAAEALRNNVAEFAGVLVDARREEVFCTLVSKEKLANRIPLSIRTREVFFSEIQSIAPQGLIVQWKEERLPPGYSTFIPVQPAEEMIRTYLQTPRVFSSDIHGGASLSSIEPHYLRPVAAKTIRERQDDAIAKSR